MIVLYFILIFIIGLIKSKKTSSIEYLYASRKLTLTSFIATIVTTWYGAILDVGRYTYEFGIITWLLFCLFYYFSAFIYGFFIAPKIHTKNISSLPEFFNNRIGKSASFIASILIFLIGSPIPYIIIFSSIITHVYEINYLYSVIIGVLSSNIYLYIGGFKSVIRTDKFQFILMYLGFGILLYNLYTNFGGYDFIINNVPERHLSFNVKDNIGLLISWFFISFTIFIDPSIFQRAYSANKSSNIKKGFLLSIIFWFIFDLMTITTGLYASAIIDNNNLFTSPFLQLSSMALPGYLNTIFIISLLAIVMSTIDSTTFISSITLNNFLANNEKTKQINLNVGLTITGVFSIIMCYYFREAIGYWYIFGTISASTIMIPFIFLLYNDNYYIEKPLLTLLLPLSIAVLCIITKSIEPIYPGIISSLILTLFNSTKNKD